MDKQEARKLLESPNSHERLQAARHFVRHASPEDKEFLQFAVAKEETHWVLTALREALDVATSGLPPEDGTATVEFDGEDQTAGIYSEALQETTGLLVHELEPIVGRLRVYVEKEIGPKESRLRDEIDRLAECLRAIDTLSRTAAPPVASEFDLAGVVSDCVVQVADVLVGEHVFLSEEETEADSEPPLSIGIAGATPFLVVGDRTLVELALTNALKNAIEATLPEATYATPRQVVISWGKENNHYWISIMDEGPGLPPGASGAFDIGTTTKEGHLGMGLALMRRAMRTMGGDANLFDRGTGGARCELTWRRPENGERPTS